MVAEKQQLQANDYQSTGAQEYRKNSTQTRLTTHF